MRAIVRVMGLFLGVADASSAATPRNSPTAQAKRNFMSESHLFIESHRSINLHT